MNPMRQIRNMISRGVVALVNPGSKLQALQMRLNADEVKSGMEHFEPYGFTAHPHLGAEGIALFFGGDRSHGVVINVADRQFRVVELEAGEVAIYTDEKDTLIFKRGNVVELTTKTFRVNAETAVEVNTPTFTVNAASGAQFNTPEINATGRIVSDGDQIAAGVSQVNHPHQGVTKGLEQSGPPVVSA